MLIEAYKPTFVKSMVMVPVRPSDAIAAIGAYWATRHFATDDDVACLRILADSASLALANVQLHAETRAAFEREQQARAAAEHATAAKDEFLALVSHELRQPLHASMAAVRMLTANPDHPETAERARDVIERQIQHMTRLVEDLLDASRIVRGHVTLQLVPIDVRTAVEHVSDIIRPMMEERSHVFTVAVPDSPVFVNADSGRFEQVLMNLLTNAAKYSDPGGRIALSVVVAAGDVVISVRDNGQGIDPAILPRIFDLFTRGAGTASGFGVGLAVVRGLVELHGGTLEARSEGVGRGSEFVVRLPMMDATAVKST